MKLVLFERIPESYIRPGILIGGGVVDITDVVRGLDTGSPQQLMERIIDSFDDLRVECETLMTDAVAIPLSDIMLRAPLPRPGKILCCIGNYWEHSQRNSRPLNMFLKNPDAVIGPGEAVVLPRLEEPYVFHHEAELAIVIKGSAKEVREADWGTAIFGYTCLIDVSARAEGRRTWRDGSWMGKSFDTFAPLGPCIVTADEIPDPNHLAVKFWVNQELRHDYNTDDMEHKVPELIAFATSIMTLNTGDLISCGTNHEGLGPLQDGDLAEIEIQGIGRLSVEVLDPLKRRWEPSVYMGPGSTAPTSQSGQ